MVSINFHQYRVDIRRALLATLQSLCNDWDPFVAAWICYALAVDGIENNQPLLELRERMRRWRLEEDVWKYRRNVGPIALVVWLFRDPDSDAHLAAELSETVQRLSADDKFSPLRDGEQVFLLALGVHVGADEAANTHLRNLAVQEMQRGPLRRRILYAAALRELGETVSCPTGEPEDDGDVIALAWWSERYGGDKYAQWARFSTIQERITLDTEMPSEAQRVLTVAELAMLYEAVARETADPDPEMLFDSYPLHPRIREISERDFKQGNYFGAVFEAGKAFYDFLRAHGDPRASEVQLVKEVLGEPDATGEKLRPRIKLNPLDPRSSDYTSQQNEQRGYSHIGVGIFLAFRHLKGHEPKDKHWVSIEAYEALDQLVTISAVMKRIEKALTSGP